MNETWLPIPGYEGKYSVSDLGRVRSEQRQITFPDGRGRIVPERILKPVLHRPSRHKGKSYYRVSLGRRDTQYVHVLVAQAFLDQIPGLWVLHRDDNSLNNTASNLYYGTPKDNTRDAVVNGTHRGVNQTHCMHGHEFTPENTSIRINPETGNQTRHCITCSRQRAREAYLATKDLHTNSGVQEHNTKKEVTA